MRGRLRKSAEIIFSGEDYDLMNAIEKIGST